MEKEEAATPTESEKALKEATEKLSKQVDELQVSTVLSGFGARGSYWLLCEWRLYRIICFRLVTVTIKVNPDDKIIHVKSLLI